MTTRGGDADGPADLQQAPSLPSRPLSTVQEEWAYQSNFLATKSGFLNLPGPYGLLGHLLKIPAYGPDSRKLNQYLQEAETHTFCVR